MKQIGPTFQNESASRATLRAMGLLTLTAIMAARKLRSAFRQAIPVAVLAALLALPLLTVILVLWLR